MKCNSKLLLVLFTLLMGTGILHAQFKIKGRLVDENKEALPAGTVMLLSAEDSVLKSFALSGADGSFELRSVPKGEFILKVTYTGMSPWSQNLKITGEPPVTELGDLDILKKSTQLDDVQITGEITPIEIKGDTIQYNAGAFKTQPNATVEDLLKRLPGVEVDADGNVKAQGETVNKVLVDGKEFFGDDPKVATKNLPADAIDKVQVFDKLSEMADFTGVDDGETSRTINLSLKADRKNGIFGNIGAGYGYGDDHRFQAKASLNRFSEKNQLSFLGMGNNINERPFSMTDYINFMGGMNNLMSGGGFGRGSSNGGISPQDLGISWRGGGAQTQGINTVGAGGLNYNTEIGKKSDFQSSYFYNFLRSDLEQTNSRENIFTENAFLQLDSTDQQNQNHNHRLNLRFSSDLDSSSRLVFTGAGSFNTTNSQENSLTQSFSDNLLLNSSLVDQLTTGMSYNLSSSLSYLKRFKKRGRSLSLTGTLGGLQGQDKDIDLSTENIFTDSAGNPIQTDLDQDQDEMQSWLSYGGKATWTEPIGRNKFLEAIYTHEENLQNLNKDFYNLTTPETPVFDSLLSNRYDGVYRFDQARVNFRIVKKKSNLSLGVAGQRSELNGNVGLQDSSINKLFYNVLPSLQYRYNIRQGSRIRFRYTTRVNAPSIQQLQPVVDNSNPLNLYVGNPDLKAEYEHNANFTYMIFDQFSFTNFFTRLSFTYTQNKINSATTVDEQLRQYSTFTNVDKDMRLSWFGNFSTPIRKLKIKINATPNVSWNNGITLIDQEENPTDQLTTGMDVSVENRFKEKFDLRVGGKGTWNITRYGIATDRDQEFFNSQLYGDFTLYLKKGWTLNAKMDYYSYFGGSLAATESFPLLQASLSKTFLKADRGELKLSAFDLLNQNTGIDRTTSVNYLEETQYNTLRRYAMLSFTYRIMTIGKGKK